MYKIDDRLPNGNRITSVKETPNGYVYLCIIPYNNMTPYVTHVAHRESPGETFWGHYHPNVVDAVADFERRTF